MHWVDVLMGDHRHCAWGIRSSSTLKFYQSQRLWASTRDVTSGQTALWYIDLKWPIDWQAEQILPVAGHGDFTSGERPQFEHLAGLKSLLPEMAGMVRGFPVALLLIVVVACLRRWKEKKKSSSTVCIFSLLPFSRSCRPFQPTKGHLSRSKALPNVGSLREPACSSFARIGGLRWETPETSLWRNLSKWGQRCPTPQEDPRVVPPRQNAPGRHYIPWQSRCCPHLVPILLEAFATSGIRKIKKIKKPEKPEKFWKKCLWRCKWLPAKYDDACQSTH